MMNKSRSQTVDFSQWKVSYGSLAPRKRATIAHENLQLPNLHKQLNEKLRVSIRAN
jgi:hypothetical protein